MLTLSERGNPLCCKWRWKMERSFECLFLATGNTIVMMGLIFLVSGFFSLVVGLVVWLFSIVGASLMNVAD